MNNIAITVLAGTAGITAGIQCCMVFRNIKRTKLMDIMVKQLDTMVDLFGEIDAELDRLKSSINEVKEESGEVSRNSLTLNARIEQLEKKNKLSWSTMKALVKTFENEGKPNDSK